ncbi:MAG TPA: hypothetical protein VF981_18145 [Gemmatimonadaceae bacterium]
MTGLTSLWLPMLVSAVVVFVLSSAIHMLPLWHRTDYPSVPDEGKVMDALRPMALPPGDYMVPRPKDQVELKSPEFAEKVKRGPVLILTVLPNRMMSTGSNLVMWFVYSLVVSFFAAYVASRALPASPGYLEVFRFVGTTAFVGYSLALWQMTIWYKRDFRMTLKSTFDGLIYALFTAGTFGWLWPR